MFGSEAFACRTTGHEGVGVSHNGVGGGGWTFQDGYKVFFRGSRRLIEFWFSEIRAPALGILTIRIIVYIHIYVFSRGPLFWEKTECCALRFTKRRKSYREHAKSLCALYFGKYGIVVYTGVVQDFLFSQQLGS